MNKIFSFVVVMLCCSFRVAEPALSNEERKFAVDYLKETRDAFLKDVDGLSEAQLNFKPAPNRWSVAECMEHIAVAETALFDAVQKQLKEPANPEKRKQITCTDTSVLRVVTDRTRKSSAPEFLDPAGKFANLQEAMASYKLRRQQTIDYVLTTQDDLRDHFGAHSVLGVIDSYQVILLISAHSRRHTLQLEEVMRDPGFPK